MDFAEAVRALDTRTNYERSGSLVAPTLERMVALAELLDHPEQSFPSIHVTGTNGKTTTAQVATQLLRAAGLTVGTYTSPHLHSVRERIAYDGEPISEEDFAETMAYLAPFLERADTGGSRLTYFETLTALAEVWFAHRAIDLGVVEVGMGGTWDATNLVRGEVAVITEVTLDHPELGSMPVEVAREKVGVIKEGAVCVSGEHSPEVMAIVEDRCRARGAALRVAGRDFAIAGRQLAVGGQFVDLRVGDRSYEELFVPLYGERLATDALLGLAAVSAFLGDREIDEDVVRTALAAVRSPGRLEVVRRRPLVIVDGAHNPSAARVLADALAESFRWERLILVIGILADKDIAGVAEALVPRADAVIATRSASPRAAPVERVAKEASRLGPEPLTAATVEGAVATALELAGERDCVLVTGSLYTVGEARAALLGQSLS